MMAGKYKSYWPKRELRVWIGYLPVTGTTTGHRTPLPVTRAQTRLPLTSHQAVVLLPLLQTFSG